MNEPVRTPSESIEELSALKQRIQELEEAESGRKQAEEALRASIDRFRTMTEQLVDVLYQTDQNGTITYLSPSAGVVFGRTPEEMIGRSFVEFLAEKEIPKALSAFQGALLSRRPNKNLGLTMKRKDGSVFSGELNGTLLIKDDGVVGTLGLIRDISDRKRIEEALRESEANLREAQDMARMGRWKLDLDSNRLVCSDGIFALFEADRESFPPSYEAFRDFIHPDDRPRVDQAYRESVESKKPYEIEHRLLVKDGRIKWVREIGRTVYDESGNPIRSVGTVQDVTERKRMEEERIVMSKLESVGILAGGIAHDFNNLLTVIIGNLEMAKILPRFEGMTTDYLEAAGKAALTARDLTRQLITFAKGGSPVKKLVNMTGLLEEQVTFTLRGSPVGCTFSIASDLWLTEVDESQIGQVIRNITLNAREAMPDGGMVSVKAENVVIDAPSDLTLPAGNYVKMRFTDRGGGIAEEILPKIFDPYFSTKQRGDQKGMGLGLTICHSVIRKHGGAINGLSKMGEGTTVEVYLPASMKGEEEHPALPVDSPDSPARGRILVMEDGEMIRVLIRVILLRLGYEVEVVGDGKKTVECYRQATAQGQSFDAVIVDLMVQGGMGGVETVRELVKIDPAVKAIVSSGYYNDPVIQNYEQYGFRGSLSKPFQINDLREILSRVIGTDKISHEKPGEY